jgi:glycosyltransferase involved in cell wall biosynthesis
MTSEIDVVIPVYEVDAYLGEAIDSALNQKGVTTRVIVVDAGSPRPVSLLAAHEVHPRVHLVRSEVKLRSGAARNLGVIQGSAPYLTFLDADDVWPEGRCATLLEILTNSQVDIALGQVIHFGEPDTGLVIPPDAKPAFLAGGILLRRSTFERIGPFDSELGLGEFVEWFSRGTSLRLTHEVSPETALLRRVHRASTTAQAALTTSEMSAHDRLDYLKVVRTWMNKNP